MRILRRRNERRQKSGTCGAENAADQGRCHHASGACNRIIQAGAEPVCCLSTEARTAVVSGATAPAMPIAINSTEGIQSSSSRVRLNSKGEQGIRPPQRAVQRQWSAWSHRLPRHPSGGGHANTEPREQRHRLERRNIDPPESARMDQHSSAPSAPYSRAVRRVSR